MSGVPQADGYAEGLACEHQYMIGPPCGDEAVVLLRGIARCEYHFEQFVRAHDPRHWDDLRKEAQRLATFTQERDLGDETDPLEVPDLCRRCWGDCPASGCEDTI